MEVVIRPARPADAAGISRVVVAALKHSNARDYPPAVIARVAENFSPTAILGQLKRRRVFVAAAPGGILGTASLDGQVVRTVFIDPAWQGRGLGRALMAKVEQAARDRGVALLSVPSSVTAEAFYARLGYTAVRDSHHGEERTIVMERRLP